MGSTGSGYLSRAEVIGGVTLDFEYDGFLKTGETASGDVPGDLRWMYGENLLLTEFSVNGDSIGYGYDLDGTLVSAGEVSIDYNAGTYQPATVSVGSIARTTTFDTYGYPSRIATNGDSPLSFDYAYDDFGRITQITEIEGGTTRVIVYRYDEQGRIDEVRVDGGVTELYRYDANGNRTTTRTLAPNQIVYNAEDELTTYGSVTFTYASGQRRARREGAETIRYTYGMMGELRRVDRPTGLIEYVHDAANRRVGKRVAGVFQRGWLYQDALNPVAELDAAGQVVSRFVYGSKPHVPDYMVRGGRTYALVSDHLGSVRQVVDTSDGTVVQSLRYDTFGTVLSDSAPGFQPFGFAGGLYDFETGLVRFGARDYDAFTGTWTARDPIGFAGGSTNLYQYVNGDPVNFIDFDGHAAFLAVLLGAEILGAGVYLLTTPRRCWTTLGAVGYMLGFMAGAAITFVAPPLATALGTELTVAGGILTAQVSSGTTYAISRGIDPNREVSVEGVGGAMAYGAIGGPAGSVTSGAFRDAIPNSAPAIGHGMNVLTKHVAKETYDRAQPGSAGKTSCGCN